MKTENLINKKRMIENFISMAKISSLSLNERKMADFVKKKFRPFSNLIYEDNAGSKIKGNSGNVIIKIKGNKSLKKSFLLSAHLDTVGPVGKIKPILKKDKITSDKKTILGADCKAGIAIILEILSVLKENNLPHPPFEIILSVSEEMGLLGVKNLNYSKISSKYGLIFDNEQDFENVILKAPSANHIEIKINGKASHSGVEPEKGISAIQIASDFLSNIKLGRIDNETTLNIGLINGGESINIIAPYVTLKGEIRSRKIYKIKNLEKLFINNLKRVSLKWKKKINNTIFKPTFSFLSTQKFPLLEISNKEKIFSIISKSMLEMNFKAKESISGGGTDANIFSSKGIQTPILSTGMRNVHTKEEYLNLKDFFNSAILTLKIIEKL